MLFFHLYTAFYRSKKKKNCNKAEVLHIFVTLFYLMNRRCAYLTTTIIMCLLVEGRGKRCFRGSDGENH